MNKKIIFVGVIVLVILGLSFFLLSDSGNALIATVSTDEYTEETKISFKNNNKVHKITTTITCENDELLENIEKGLYYAIGLSVEEVETESALSELNTEKTDTTLRMELSIEQFNLISGINLNKMNKQEIKIALEKNGYNVK